MSSSTSTSWPDGDLLEAIKEAGWPYGKRDQKYYRSAIQELKNAYREAVADGAAIQIFIG